MSTHKVTTFYYFVPFAGVFCYTTASMFRKLLLAGVFFLCAVQVAAAQTPTPTPSSSYDAQKDPWGYKITQAEFTQYRKAVENCDTPSLECLVRNTTRFIAMEWSQDIVGSNKINNIDCTLQENKDFCAQASLQRGGVAASVFTLIGSMISSPPAHTATYVADVLNTAGVATPAYAQGIGFAALDPILGLWKVFRNVAYFFFIIGLIVMGFMIMFQQRLGGKAAITAQQAIPSVIVSLILVTFSYAIAGFAIDLMYLFMYLIVGVFKGIQASGGVGDPVSFTIIDLFSFLFSASASWEGYGLNKDIISSLVNAAGIQNEATRNFVGILGGMTLTLIVSIAVLIGCIRLFFELLKSYVIIVLSVVISPLVLMVGAFPGKDVFWPWLKGIIGNLMAFPTVLLLLIIYIEFTSGTVAQSAGSDLRGGFMPPFLFGSGYNGSGAGISMIGPILGLAMILAMPEIVKEVKKKLGAGDGGFGTVLSGWALDGLKTGWKGAMGIPGANQIPWLPVRAAGAYGAYKVANAEAKAAGLEGRSLALARLGGIVGGAGLAPAAVRYASSPKNWAGIIRQLGDTEVKRQMKNTKASVGTIKQSAQDQQRQNLISSQDDETINHGSRTQAVGGASQDDIDNLR